MSSTNTCLPGMYINNQLVSRDKIGDTLKAKRGLFRSVRPATDDPTWSHLNRVNQREVTSRGVGPAKCPPMFIYPFADKYLRGSY